MSTIKNNGDTLAYPCDGPYAGEARQNDDAGLTKREYFAGLAMAALLTIKSVDVAARLSVVAADALLLELEKPKQ